nr:hypothetical protein [Phascolarctobacterium faecium]
MRAKKAIVNINTIKADHILRIISDGHFRKPICGSVAKTPPMSAIIPAVFRLSLKPYH